MYQKFLEDLEKEKLSKSESRFASLQLLELYKEASKRESLHIVELGVDKGHSTKVFLNAINEKENSFLTSVDILDCSKVCSSPKWNFIKSDSLDLKKIIGKAPLIKEKGIDILYIDSLHRKEHVEKELYFYYPYMNKNSTIFFDDIDSFPYMMNQRKDNIGCEIENRRILEFVESVFYANLDFINFSTQKGSTGLARLDITFEKKDKLQIPKKFLKRKNKILWRLIYLVILKKSYYKKIFRVIKNKILNIF